MIRKSAIPALLPLWLSFSLAACSRPPAVQTVRATLTSVESTITTTSSGTVEARQQATLGFTTSGRIARIQVVPGQRVAAGAVLAELENEDLRAVFRQTEAERKRSRSLFAAKLIARSELDEADKAYEVAKANLERSIIRAPFDGLVTDVNLDLGELAQPALTNSAETNAGKPPVRIVDLEPRIVKGEIDEADLARVKPGDPARVRILAARPEPFRAVVTRVVPYVSTTKEQDRTSEIELRVEEASALIPVGSSADVEIEVQKKERVLAVPARAVLGIADNKYVFLLEGDRVRKHPVKLGIGNYERSEILEGLKAGDEVALPSENVTLDDRTRIRPENKPWP